MTRLERTELGSNIVTSIIQTLLLLVVAAYAIYQYETSHEAVLEDRSMSLMDEYYLGNISASRQAIESTLNRIDNEWKTLGDTGELPQRNVQRITRFAGLAIETFEAQGQLDEVRRIIDFYDLVSWCLEEEMCSRTSLTGRLAQEAVSYYTFARGYIFCTRSEFNVPTFGQGIENFVVEIVLNEVEGFGNYQFDTAPDCSEIQVAELLY
jgi:hypothetical protein